MKISIITVCYNSESTIKDTLDSVRQQTYHDIEYIVIDGGSIDSTLDIINKYSDVVRVLVSEPDQGIYDAMNKGIKLSSGDYVGILNSDDVYADEYVIDDLVRNIEELGRPEAVYSDLEYVKQDNIQKVTRGYSFPYYSRWMIRFGLMIPHPTFYAKPALFDKIGFYRLDFKVAADFELMARAMLSGVNPRYYKRCSVKMREGGVSSSGFTERVKQNYEIIRALRDNGVYSNAFLLLAKIPLKILSYVKR